MLIGVTIVKCRKWFTIFGIWAIGFACHVSAAKLDDQQHHMDADEFSYLEDNGSERTRSWIARENSRTLGVLESDPRYRGYYNSALKTADALTELNNASFWLKLHDGWMYKLFADSVHPKGLWRRTSLSSYLSGVPQWRTLLDVDAFAAREGRPWILAPGVMLNFSPNGHRCLLRFSEGDTTRNEFREFDIETATFVEGGFRVPLGRGASAVWRNDDTLIVSTDFGTASLTQGGAPMVVKEWVRGHPLSEAREVFRGRPDDYGVLVLSQDSFDDRPEDPASGNLRIIRILRHEHDLSQSWWQFSGENRLERMTLPAKSYGGMFASYGGHTQYLFMIREDWAIGGRIWKAGSLLSIPAPDIARTDPQIHLVLEPSQEESIVGDFVATRAGLLIIGSHLGVNFMWRVRLVDGSWRSDRVPVPPFGLIRMCVSDRDRAYVLFESFLQPPTLYQVSADPNEAIAVKISPPQFDSGPYITEQLEVKSADGVAVPYFVTRRRAMKSGGGAPTLVQGYGAYGLSSSPRYSPSLGKLWLEQGGVYVVANIRGGRERGEAWHVTGLKRQHTYDDMLAVVQDLIHRKITSPKRIAVMGYSAGGLVAGVMINQHPELVGAAILRAPKIDNFRYDLSVGTWDAQCLEFGSPNIPDELAFMQRTSPFQNLERTAHSPVPLILTASDDSQVLPSQPRRFAAKMESLHMPAYFYESPDGGHGGGSTGAGQARLDALMYTYLARELALPADSG